MPEPPSHQNEGETVIPLESFTQNHSSGSSTHPYGDRQTTLRYVRIDHRIIYLLEFLTNIQRRNLKERHVNMIGFSTVLGVGLFLSGGKAIYMAGPGGAVLAYLFAGSIMWYVVKPSVRQIS